MVIKHQNDQIIGFLDKKVAERIHSLPPDLPVQLPIKSENDIRNLENYCQEKENLMALVKFLNDLLSSMYN